MTESSNEVADQRAIEVELELARFLGFLYVVAVLLSCWLYPTAARGVKTLNEWFQKSAQRERHCDLLEQRTHTLRVEMEDDRPEVRLLAERRFRSTRSKSCVDDESSSWGAHDCVLAESDGAYDACMVQQATRLEYDIAHRRRANTVAEARTFALARDEICRMNQIIADVAARERKLAAEMGYRWDGFDSGVFAAQELRVCVDEPVTTMLVERCWYAQDYDCLVRLAQEVRDAIPDIPYSGP
ncbi:MAG TPA: hypothetical protein VFV99_26565 [Kofleriaceae bacterium]|nr:hypothetical protein [Kofleriaceae bacterium]